MKKRNILGALLCSVCLVASNAMPAMADATKVVTLGADLTQEQKNTMMRYFKVDSNQVQMLTITNQNERDHLSSYVPLEQIGSRTVSCAYVKPTQSGGIKVRTANLNWVTCNMIATQLSTSGVTNCEVVAACPFEVSGTGALTGIIMAYESASGQKLDETKKQLATREMVVTGNLAENVGQNEATKIVNQAKMQIIGDNVQNADEIYNIVYNIATQNNVQMSDEQFDKIVSLLEEIAQQNYDYDQMKETLENVEQNVDGESEVALSPQDDDDDDSIVNDLDESVLGEDVIADSTEDPTLAAETNKEQSEEVNTETEVPEASEGTIEGIPEASGDGTWDETSSESGDGAAEEIPEASGDGAAEEIPEASGDGAAEEIPEASGDGAAEEIPEASGDGMTEEAPPAEGEAAASGELSTDSLSEESLSLFNRAKTFCSGEYEGDGAALQEAMGDGVTASVYLDAETGAKVSKEVQKDYLEILKNGAASYVPSEMDSYMTAELNMLDSKLRKLFGLEVDESGAEDILVNVSTEDKEILYDDTMRFFESLYGESGKAYDELMDPSEQSADTETPEEMPEETTEEYY